jgi:pyocin large subunit-like protein
LICKGWCTNNKAKSEQTGILGIENDWQTEADHRRQLRFPPEILSPKLRPDIVIWSSRGRKVIILELTVHLEEHMEDAYERKMAKYQKLVEESQDQG